MSDNGTKMKLSGAEIDTLVALVENGPLKDGHEPSKSGRDSLISWGFAVRIVNTLEDGWTAATYAGRDAYKEYFNTALGGKADTMREAHASRLARRLINNAGSQ